MCARLQVQLYEVVMMLFEREAAPEGAVMFARAALQHLPAAYGSSSSSSSSHVPGEVTAAAGPQGVGGKVMEGMEGALAEGDQRRGAPTAQEHRRRQQRAREARLWSNIFKYCSELGQWEDAYAALVCNPDPHRALECLRQMIKVGGGTDLAGSGGDRGL